MNPLASGFRTVAQESTEKAGLSEGNKVESFGAANS